VPLRLSARFAVTAGAALLSVSCGASKFRPVAPVEGTVFYQGKPAAGATVLLVPEADQGEDKVRPHGVADADGKFQLTTYHTHDGAPPGRYAVAISWPAAAGKAARPEDEGPQIDKLDGAYSDPKTSRLTAEIREGPNVLRFHLPPKR
jgi:hypothetical protein